MRLPEQLDGHGIPCVMVLRAAVDRFLVRGQRVGIDRYKSQLALKVNMLSIDDRLDLRLSLQ